MRNDKQAEEFVFSLIFNMLGCWVKVLISFATGSLSKSTLQGRSIWRLSTIFSKWSLNTFSKSVSAVITLLSSTRNIFSFLRALSVKLDLIFFQKFLLSVSASRWNSYRNLFLSLEKFNAVRTLSYVCQLIFCAIKFHNWFSKLFIHKHSLITSDIFIF